MEARTLLPAHISQLCSAGPLHGIAPGCRRPKAELRASARSLATTIAAKDPLVIRLAKQSLNGIDPVDVKRSYRYEQGFTYELNLAGAGERARQAFVDEASAGNASAGNTA